MIELKCRKNSSLKVQVISVPLIKKKKKEKKREKENKGKKGYKLSSKNPPLDRAF